MILTGKLEGLWDDIDRESGGIVGYFGMILTGMLWDDTDRETGEFMG